MSPQPEYPDEEHFAEASYTLSGKGSYASSGNRLPSFDQAPPSVHVFPTGGNKFGHKGFRVKGSYASSGNRLLSFDQAPP